MHDFGSPELPDAGAWLLAAPGTKIIHFSLPEPGLARGSSGEPKKCIFDSTYVAVPVNQKNAFLIQRILAWLLAAPVNRNHACSFRRSQGWSIAAPVKRDQVFSVQRIQAWLVSALVNRHHA